MLTDTSRWSLPRGNEVVPSRWRATSLRTLRKIARIANPERLTSADDLARHPVNLCRLVGSPAHPADPDQLRQHAHECFQRAGIDLAVMQRQTAAIAAGGDRRIELGAIAARRGPALVGADVDG